MDTCKTLRLQASIFISEGSTMNYKTRKIAMLGVLAALAYLSVVLINIPVVSVDFLKYEPKDVVIALGGLMFGPLEAALLSVVVSLLEMVTISSTGVIGCVMNILSMKARSTSCRTATSCTSCSTSDPKRDQTRNNI